MLFAVSMKKILKFPFHSILFAIFPAISLMAHNLGQISLLYIIRPLIVFALLALILIFLVNAVVRNWAKTGLIVTPMVIASSTYGIVYDVIQNKTLLGFSLNHRLGLLLVFVILIAGITIFVISRKSDLKLSNQFLTVVSIAAVLLPTAQLISYMVTSKSVSAVSTAEQNAQIASAENKLPDIYYFILDGYSRSDKLAKTFNIDNSAFLDELNGMGFYIAGCSRSNYANTRLSLASSLNMGYLDVIAPRATPDIQSIGILDDQILHSKVRSDLEAMGYKTVSFQTGYLFSEFHDAAYYIQTSSISLTSPYISPFESLLLDETGFKLLETIPAVKIWSVKSPLYEKYLIEKNKISNVGHLDIPSPKFVFVHLLAAHRPFIFSPTGDVQSDDNYYAKGGMPVDGIFDKKGYANGIKYLDSALIPIIHNLLDSKTRPIIIIQGDHGNMARKQRQILNAYYFPDMNYESLYPSISPVNSFRALFNKYFSSSMPMLPDRSYASQIDPDPFVLTESKDETAGCAPK
jgi:hypothetical protein